MLNKEENKNLLKGVDYAKGKSKSVTNFLETECPKCNHKIEFRLAIKDIKNVEEYIEQLESKEQKLIEKLETNLEELEILHDNYIDANVIDGTYETLGRINEIRRILEILKGEKKC